MTASLSPEELERIHGYWRACNYLAAGMIYLRDNPLLRKPLEAEHVKSRLLGHWGASPALSFSYVHLNRLIRKYDLDAIFLAGPGHGAPGVLGPVYLEGTYAEIYPEKGEDEEGLRRFFKDFSFPGGIGSHCTPETPGSIHEGGELVPPSRVAARAIPSRVRRQRALRSATGSARGRGCSLKLSTDRPPAPPARARRPRYCSRCAWDARKHGRSRARRRPPRRRSARARGGRAAGAPAR